MTSDGNDTIAYFGGSFNPPHTGHFDLAAWLHSTPVKLDEITMLLSLNPDKDPNTYASLFHRMAMCRLHAAHYPNVPITISDAEERCKSHQTSDVLDMLQAENPQKRIVFVIGVDNLLTFEHWHNAEKIFENFSIIVLMRPPFTEQQALDSVMAKTYPHLRHETPEDFNAAKGGWMLMHNPPMNISSRNFLKDLREGIKPTDPRMLEIADYIYANGLYGITPPGAAPAPVIPVAPRPAP